MPASPEWDVLFVGVRVATMAGGAPYGAVDDGALAASGSRIAWAGPAAELPGRPAALARKVHDLGGRWMTPGLIDCHTHLVYAGNRAREFEMLLEGRTYADIAKAGGGIRETVAATRAASEDALFRAAAKRLEALLAEGVTTVEVKSGYGLDLETELRMLRVARRLGRELPADVRATFLGAHVTPAEFAGDAAGYMAFVCEDVLPRVAAEGLADAVDGFLDPLGFDRPEIERLFRAARALGLPVKLHTEQFRDLGGGGLAAGYGALSADHLEYVAEADIAAMSAAGTVAVLLPGAFYFTRETKAPPVKAMRAAGLAMAVATDSNPGSSPVLSLLLMLNMACTLFRLTPEEALAGVTRNAARALGLAADRGTLEAGKRADLAVWDVGHPVELAYAVGADMLAGVVRAGAVTRNAGAFG